MTLAVVALALGLAAIGLERAGRIPIGLRGPGFALVAFGVVSGLLTLFG